MMIKTDLLIVGGGIAGPALAAALVDSDLSVTLIERSADLLDTARGDHLQPRSVEILERWGALASIMALAPERRAGTIWYDGHGQALLRAMVDELEVPHPYFLFLNHELISRALLDAAARNPKFQLLRPIRSWSVSDRRADRITLTVEHEAQSLTIEARLLVGADGHSSVVRRLTDIHHEQQRYERPINVLFGHLESPLPGNCLTPYLSEKGILAVIPRTGQEVKIGVAGSPQDTRDWRQATSEALREKLRPFAPELPISQLRYAGVYPPTRTQAERWVDGNIVLIGDACHSMHPAQSQGMNVTLHCVDQLGLVLSEARGDLVDVLPDYERKTRPSVEPILAANHQAGLLFDRPDADGLNTFAQQLASIQSDPMARQAYSLRSAGYAAQL